jgi:hypothetical protein
MQRLRLHYDGPDKRKSRISEAENDIKKAHYKIERNFPFEKYVTKLTGAFQVLAHYDEPYLDDKNNNFELYFSARDNEYSLRNENCRCSKIHLCCLSPWLR